MLGIPNSTSCTQEQDQLYQEFKGKTCAKTDEVYAEKLLARNNKIKEVKECLHNLGFKEEWSECENQNANVTPEMKDALSELKSTMKQSCLTNNDLPVIVNDKPNDSPFLSLFLSTFTHEKITNSFRCVGYVPFTRACLKSEYIRHKLKENGQQHEHNIEDLVAKYET